MLDNRKRWDLERVIWFSWRDVSKEEVPKGCTYCRKFGLLQRGPDPEGRLQRIQALRQRQGEGLEVAAG